MGHNGLAAFGAELAVPDPVFQFAAFGLVHLGLHDFFFGGGLIQQFGGKLFLRFGIEQLVDLLLVVDDHLLRLFKLGILDIDLFLEFVATLHRVFNFFRRGNLGLLSRLVRHALGFFLVRFVGETERPGPILEVLLHSVLSHVRSPFVDDSCVRPQPRRA